MVKNKYCTIYLVRHALSVANLTGIMGGDSPLADEGKIQAMELGRKFKDIQFSAVFSSHKLRAMQTAKLIIEGRGLSIQKVEGLKERSFGSLDLRTNAEYKNLFDALKDMSEKEVWEWKIVDDMESAQEAVGRFSKALEEIAKAYLGKKVLVVGHGTVNRSFLVKIGYSTFKELGNGTFKNVGYAVLKSDGKDFVIEETFGVTKKNN